MVDIQQNKIMEAEQEGINPFNNPTPGESLTKTQTKDLNGNNKLSLQM